MSRNRSPLAAFNREAIGARRQIPQGLRLAAPGGGGSASAAPPTSYALQVTGEETLYTGGLGTIKGIATSGTTLTILPVAVPVTATTYSTGLSAGKIYDPITGVLGTTLVWIANRPVNPGTGIISPNLTIPLPTAVSIICFQKVSMPVTGGGFADVYLPYVA